MEGNQNPNQKQEQQRQAEPEELMAGISNIKTTEQYTLPSKGLIYDPALKIPAAVTLRRMTTKEDKMRMRNISENAIKRDILQACIMENIDASALTVVDANFLLFKLRVLSLLDDTYKVRCRCPHCGTEFIHQINLSEVPTTYLSEDKLSLMKIELPISKQKIDFKVPSLNDILRMEQHTEEYFQQYPNADRDEYIYIMSTILYINKVNGANLMEMEKEHWLEELDIVDSRAVVDIARKLDNLYGFTERIIGKCPSCGNDVSHGLPITSELFSPSK